MAKITIQKPVYYKREGSNSVFQLLSFNTINETFATHDIVLGCEISQPITMEELNFMNLTFELSDLNRVRDEADLKVMEDSVAKSIHIIDYFQQLNIIESITSLIRLQANIEEALAS